MITKPEKQAIITAVRKLGKRITVADVVAATGLSLQVVSQGVNELAGTTLATLEVTDQGRVYYSFPASFYYIYLAHGLKRYIDLIWQRLLRAVFFLFRISFGVMLIVSITTLLLISLLFQSLLAAWLGATNRVVAIWLDAFSLYKRFLIDQVFAMRIGKAGSNAEQTSNFLFDVYLFLFGEGNPNRSLEENRWKLIAQVIRLNEGVVLEEHLSPYIGGGQLGSNNEPALFRVLAKFDGQPHVTETGNIIYLFPSMRGRSDVASYAFVPPYLEEKSWQFSPLTKERLRPVLMLGLINLAGTWLFWSVSVFDVLHHKPLPWFYAFLAWYGVLFMIIPAIRWLAVKQLNKGVARRNLRARSAETWLGNPSPLMVSKLEEAEQVRHSEAAPASQQIVYTTAEDVLEQSFKESSG